MPKPSPRKGNAPTFAQLLSGPTIDILVGHEKKQWTLHLDLLRHFTSHFEQKSGKDGNLLLPDDDPKGFALLVQWLYQGKLDDFRLLPNDEAKYEHAVACQKLHVLATKFGMHELENLAFDRYRHCLYVTQLVPDAEEMDGIYRSTPKGSPLRALMTEIAARQIMDPNSEKNAETYQQCLADPTFAIGMVNAIRTMSRGMLFDDPTSPARGTSETLSNTSGSKTDVAPKANQARQRAGSRLTQSEHPTPKKLPSTSQDSPMAPNNTPHHRLQAPARRTVSQPQRPQQTHKSANTSASRAASVSNFSSPGKPSSNVDGIVRQLNNLSTGNAGCIRSQGARSETSTASRRKQPRKLRRGSTSTANASGDH